MPSALKERIYELYEAFSAGRFDQLSDMLDDNIDFASTAPVEVFPYLGRRVGKEEVLKALAAVHREFDAINYFPNRVIVEEQSAGVVVSIRLTQRSTGRIIWLFSAHFLRFRDNRLIEYRAFLDTFEAVQQVLGHEFDVSR